MPEGAVRPVRVNQLWECRVLSGDSVHPATGPAAERWETTMRRLSGSVLAVLLLAAACSSADKEPEQAAAEGAPTLQAMVGTEEQPDAFEISLVDENGQPVTELTAGKYNVE